MPLERLQRMRLLRGHENQLPALEPMFFSSDGDFDLSFQHLHQRIEWLRARLGLCPSSKANTVTLPAAFFTISRLTIEPSW